MLVLTEDHTFYESDPSWQTCFGLSFPRDYGIHFSKMDLQNFTSLEAGLVEMEQDLGSEMNVVLVTKGPLVSWLAPYYLESLPLSGLVMVDPIELTRESARDLKRLYPPDASEHEVLDRICRGDDSRPLLLEPGVLPILVLSTRVDFVHDAIQVATRHSDPDSSFGRYTVKEVDGTDEDEIANLIHRWIDDSVL
jgi:hypothetical protein